MNKILVTGGSGFIGRPCLDHLLKCGAEVHTLSRSARDLPPGVQVHSLDLLASGQVRELLARIRPTHLLHLAWVTTPGKYWTAPENLDWVSASLFLLKEFAAHGGRRAVGAGSCAEYDWSLGTCHETRTPLQPATLYGVCKNSLRAMGEAFARQAGISFAWGRLFFLYGPREYPQRLVASVIQSLLQGKPAPCSGGQQIRDFLYVEDAADALVKLLLSEVTGPVNVASGEPVAIREIVEEIGRRIGHPELLRLGALPTPPSDPLKLLADVTRLREEVHWFPHFDLGTGLTRSIAWWKNNLKGI